jgi:hypothetical protein
MALVVPNKCGYCRCHESDTAVVDIPVGIAATASISSNLAMVN